jgi:hypothetical protein
MSRRFDYLTNLLYIPDLQAKPGDELLHVEALNKYILAKRPEYIVQGGDLWDMPSLSSYDRGKKKAWGKFVVDDWEIGVEAVAILMDGWKDADYDPIRIFVKGNHEERIDRYIEANGELTGIMPDPIAFMEDMGWEAYDFLEPVTVEGITFCHFFPKTLQGTVTAASSRSGARSAAYQLKANMKSCIAGHKQGLDTASFCLPGGRIRSIIAGSYYMHDEDYMGPHGNDYWRGVLMLNRVNGVGDFDLTEVSLDYLMEKYG